MDLEGKFNEKWIGVNSFILDILSSRQLMSHETKSSLFTKLKSELFTNELEDISQKLFFDKYQLLLTQFLENEKFIISSYDSLLEGYNSSWNYYFSKAQRINTTLTILSRRWTIDAKQEWGHHLCLFLMIRFWEKFVFRSFQDKMSIFILDTIGKDRNNQQVDWNDKELAKNLIQSIVLLGLTSSPGIIWVTESNGKHRRISPREYETGLYTNDIEFLRVIEDKLIESTEIYCNELYNNVVKSKAVTSTISFEEIHKEIIREEVRCTFYCPQSTQAIVKLFQDKLVNNNIESFMGHVIPYIQNEEWKELEMLSLLLKRTENGISNFVSFINSYLLEVGHRDINNIIKPNDGIVTVEYIQLLMNICSRISKLISIAFKDQIHFNDSLTATAQSLVNYNKITILPCGNFDLKKTPRLLASYIIKPLLCRRQVEVQIDDATITQDLVNVFQYLVDKDALQKFYIHELKSRFLKQEIMKLDIQLLFIQQLKIKMDFEFTSIMQQMLQDIQVSQKLSMEYKKFQEDEGHKYEFSSLVVPNRKVWELKQSAITNSSLPLQFESDIKSFTGFYNNNTMYKHRSLTWFHNYTVGEVVTNCFKSNKTLMLTLPQMSILLLYNSQDSLQISQIMQETKLLPGIIIESLNSFLKIGLLLHQEIPNVASNERDVNSKDSASTLTFRLNQAFQNPQGVINLKTPTSTTTSSSKTKSAGHGTRNKVVGEIEQIIDADHKLKTQAVTVRIMKNEKEMNHDKLFKHVCLQLATRFQLTRLMFTQSIRILLSKEYIKVKKQEDDGKKGVEDDDEEESKRSYIYIPS